MLQVSLIGNIGQDAVLKEVNGSKFISFTVAVNERYKNKNGENVEKINWVSCLLRGEPKIKDYLLKGAKVYVQGQLNVSVFKDSKGSYQSGINCIVDRVIPVVWVKNEVETKVESSINPEMMPDPVEDDLPF